ncbi:MAG: redoxin family protein [Opitutales bacterium]|jgi:thiol-disulfide isomerase/thioredoxin|nr:redoxin family protein [Opitutales bacterium]MDP4659041.1 redoxin family protein [Opitutales bacterium]MDP4775383.1 redoxin family protein [Opitutales bacterium]MDP4787388.1 redoxin family protein [Opitutales bacterium]MDP4860621.1 redoxin family protein [Opitutales bacterium]
MRTLLLLLLSATLSAAGLKVGDPAPATRPETMLQGEAVKDFQKGEVYVFECWASWCGPCVAAIPHLNQLHKQMGKKGVVITGVNVWESERDAASAQRAKDFLKAQGDKMSYAVALGGKAFIKDWLEAAEVNGIPHAFVVAEGKIAWTGHPGQLTAEMLGDILTGTPLAAAPPIAEKIPQRRLSKPAVPAGTAPNDPEMAAAQAKLDALSEAMRARDWDAAEKALPAAAGVLPKQEGQELRDSIEAQIGLARGDPTKFYAQLQKVADEEFDDPEALNEIAWRLLTMKAFAQKPNLALAEKCAVQSVKLTREEHPDKLDTLARLRWLQGKKEEAIRLQIKSVDKAEAGEMKAALQKTLDAMLKGVLPPADDEEELPR